MPNTMKNKANTQKNKRGKKPSQPNGPKLTWIFLLSVAGVLIVASILGVSRANHIRSNTPIVIDEAVIDIIDITTVDITPAPTATPELPQTAVTLLVDRQPVMTLSSEPETQRILWAHLQASAVAPEGETFVSARFARELIISKPEGGVEVSTSQEAETLLSRAPGAVPVEVKTLRTERVEAAIETTETEDEALGKGQRIITQLGAGGITETVTPVTYVAGSEQSVGQTQTLTLREARATIIKTGAYTKRDTSGEPDDDEGKKGKSKGDLKLEWPMRGNVSSHFGFRDGRIHNGVDIENRAGTQINAPGEGIVTYCGERGAYGFVVDIDHGNGFVSRLTHLQEVAVEFNQRVFLGDPVGTLADNSTQTNRPHLHYELIIDNVPYNPAFYVS